MARGSSAPTSWSSGGRRTYGLPWSITHSANNYGPRQYPEKLIPSMVRRALRGEPMPLYGDGHQTREWLHVHDHNAMLASVLLAPDMAGQSVNLGTAEERTNLDVVTMVCDAVDASLDARRFGPPPTRPFEAGLREPLRWGVMHDGCWEESTAQTTPAGA